MYLFDAISPAQAAALRAKALAMPFEDGARTSGIASAGVKVNKRLADVFQRLGRKIGNRAFQDRDPFYNCRFRRNKADFEKTEAAEAVS